MGIVQYRMKPEIHNGIKLAEDCAASPFAYCNEVPTYRVREEEKTIALIAILVVLQMRTMAFPFSDRIAQDLILFVQHFVIKEPGIFEIFHKFKSVCF